MNKSNKDIEEKFSDQLVRLQKQFKSLPGYDMVDWYDAIFPMIIEYIRSTEKFKESTDDILEKLENPTTT